MSEDLQVIATLVAKKGHEATVRNLLLPAVRQFRGEPGCGGYVLLEDKKVSGTFLTYETWADQSALDVHMKSAVMSELAPKLKPLLKDEIKQDLLLVLLELS